MTGAAALRPYTAADAESASAFFSAAAGIDTTLKSCPLEEWRAFVAQSFNNDGRDFVLAEVEGQVAALLMSTRYPANERIIRNVRVVVHPDFRRRGIGAQLADLIERQDPDRDTTIRASCLGSWAVGRAMLEARGFRVVRSEMMMVMRPTPTAPIDVDGVLLRPATPDDDGDWARLVEEGYADGPDYTPMRSEDIAVFRSERGFRLWFAEVDGRVVGKCHVRPFGGGAPWINSVVVSPSHRGRRIGRSLMVHALNALAIDGVERIHLGVRVENTAAVALYRSLGFETDETETIWWHETAPSVSDTRSPLSRGDEPA